MPDSDDSYDETKLVPERFHIGVDFFVPARCLDGAKQVPGRCHIGSNLVPARCQGGGGVSVPLQCEH